VSTILISNNFDMAKIEGNNKKIISDSVHCATECVFSFPAVDLSLELYKPVYISSP
jgi:hypothetical protein